MRGLSRVYRRSLGVSRQREGPPDSRDSGPVAKGEFWVTVLWAERPETPQTTGFTFTVKKKNKPALEAKSKQFYWNWESGGGYFSCSVMFNSFATPWTIACQAPLSMGFPRQE